MKHFARFLWLAGLLTLCLCLAFTACDGGDTEADTTPALSDTAALTEPATETPTEPETEAPVLMPTVDLDKLAADDAGAFVTRPTKCEVSFENDETEGKFLRMTTKSITAAGTAKPYILL